MADQTTQPLLAPFRAMRVVPDHAHEVVAPPYDVVNEAQARALVEGRPWHFLRVTRPEASFPAGQVPPRPETHQGGAVTLGRMVAEGVMVQCPDPAYFAYRMVIGDHVQTGIAGVAPLDAYRDHRIRRHELTRAEKENERAQHMAAVNAQTGPVFMVHRRNVDLADLLEPVVAGPPLVDVTAPDGVRHMLWPAIGQGATEALWRAFSRMDALYVADGHHRTAAADQVYRLRDKGGDGSDAPWRHFLAVTFPADEVRILPYDRVLRDLGDHDPEGFLARLGERMAVAPEAVPIRPQRAGEIGLLLGEKWYRLSLGDAPPGSAAARLDTERLNREVLGPLLGIQDPRNDPRLDFVGGPDSLEALGQRVASGDWAAAFTVVATPLETMMEVADDGAVMPPKSTWFEPKLGDGLLVNPLDD